MWFKRLVFSLKNIMKCFILFYLHETKHLRWHYECVFSPIMSQRIECNWKILPLLTNIWKLCTQRSSTEKKVIFPNRKQQCEMGICYLVEFCRGFRRSSFSFIPSSKSVYHPYVLIRQLSVNKPLFSHIKRLIMPRHSSKDSGWTVWQGIEGTYV